MAELVFTVRADYEEAIRLRKELERLAEEIRNTSDATEEGQKKINELTEAYKKTYEELNDLVESAAKNSEEMKKSGDVLPEIVLKLGGVQKASLALGKSLIKLGLSAAEAKALLAAIGSGGITLALSALALVVTKLIKRWKEKKQAIEEAKQAQQEFFDEIGKKAAPTIAKFEELRDKWVALKTEMAKTDFLDQNRKALEKLGIALNSVAEADQLFIDNADNYVRAQIRYAEADLYRAKVQEKITQAASLLAAENDAREKGTTETYWETIQDESLKSGYNPTGTIQKKATRLVADRIHEEYEAIQKEIVDEQKKVLDTEKKGNDELVANMPFGVWQTTTLQQDIDKAKSDWDTAKEALDSIWANREQYSQKQFRDAQEKEKTARENYENLVGKDRTKTVKNLSDEEEKAYNKYRDKIIQVVKNMEISLANEQISAMETNSDRVRAQLDLEKKRNIEALQVLQEEMSNLGDTDPEKLRELQAYYEYLKLTIEDLDKLKRKNLVDSYTKVEVENEEDDLDELLAQYGTYEEKRAQIHLKWLGKIEAADEEHAAVYRRLYEDELFALDQANNENLKKLFGNLSEYTRDEIEEAKRIARGLLNDQSLSTENAKLISDQLNRLNEIQRERLIPDADLGKYISDLVYLNRLQKELKEAERDGAEATEEEVEALKKLIARYKELTKEEKISAWLRGVGDLLNMVTGAFQEMADATGDSRIRQITNTLEGLSFTTDTFMKIAKKDYLGAAMNIVTQTLGAITQEVIMTKQLALNTQDFANAMKLASLYVDQGDFASVFGVDRGAVLKSYGENMVKAMEEYQKASKALQTYYWGDQYGFFLNQGSADAMEAYIDEMKKFYNGLNGLQAMQIRTKDRNGVLNFLGINDEFTTLKDLAPHIFNEDGSLNIDNTKTFLGSNLADYLDDAQRQALENAVRLQEAYEDNLQGLKDSISSIFGGLSDNLTDLIVDGIRNGTDLSVDYLKDKMLSVVDALERQMVSGMIMKYLSQYEDRMLDVAMNGSEQDMFNLYDEIFNGLDGVVNATMQAASQFEEHARQNGWDLTKLSDTYQQQATAGGFQTMSQDVATELNGRFTALQISNEGILQGILSLGESISDIILNQAGQISISDDIRRIQAESYVALIAIRDNTEAVIVPIREMRDGIEEIRKNTKNL